MKSFTLDIGGWTELITLDRLKLVHLLAGVLPAQVSYRGRPPSKNQNVPSDVFSSDLQPAVNLVSPPCGRSAFPDGGHCRFRD